MTEKKIDRRRRYVLVVDIETANFVEDAIAYDIGFAVADHRGNIYETQSLMIAEMFIDNRDLMQSAYYAEKIPQYYKDYSEGKRKMVSLLTAKRIVAKLMDEYQIADVYAYNASFDLNGLNRTMRYLTKSKMRYFFPYGTEIHCIWNMACQTIFQQKSFFRFALENGLVKENGNVMTSAEAAFRYLTRCSDFEESHTGLEDVLIETAIMAKCYAQHKAMETDIKRNCWQIPQKFFKEFAENA